MSVDTASPPRRRAFADLSPPMKLVVAASLPDTGHDLIALCRAVDDWGEVIRLTRWHGVIALCLSAFAALPAGSVPAETLVAMKRQRDIATRRSLALATELLRVTTALGAAGIESLAFKGPALSMQLFGSPAMRAPGDLDLLIDGKDLLAAAEVFRELGYLPRSPRFPIDSRSVTTLLKVRPDVEYRHPSSGHVVELHWRWQRNPWLMPLDVERVWGRRGGCELAGQRIDTPEECELFLYLCVHGCRHLWARLKWLADIAWWRADPARGPEWETLLTRSRELGVQGALEATLMLLECLSANPGAEEEGKGPAHAMATVCMERLAAPPSRPATDFSELARSLWMEWRMSDSWRARLHGIVWVRFLRPNDNDMETLLLPSRLAPLYFVLKPFLWLWRRTAMARRSSPPRDTQ